MTLRFPLPERPVSFLLARRHGTFLTAAGVTITLAALVPAAAASADTAPIPVITQTASSYTLGTPAAFTLTSDPSGGTATFYSFQLNGAAPSTVTADSSGDATITVTPTSGADTLTVTAESADGSFGGTATLQFMAAIPPSAADGDMTGDGIPDLVTVGGTSGVPSGLWVAAGEHAANGTTGSGQVVTPAVNIGTSGVSPQGSSADFDGTEVITGQFIGEGLQDYLVYHQFGQDAGEGVIVPGNGHGSFLDLTGSTAIPAFAWTSTDPNGDIPLQIANGYHADPNDNPSTPALLTVSGDATHGYYLEYYNSFGTPGVIFTSVPLTTTATPDETMDWNDWQITTSADASGNVDLFLYNAATHSLYLWRDFTIDDTNDTASFTSYHVSSHWRPGPITTLRAADINGDGTPDLWTVSPKGQVIGWLVSGLATRPAIAAEHPQWLLGQS
jgi:hypothetical protein